MGLSNNDVLQLLKAAIDTSVPAGLASPQDAEEFIDLTRDQTRILRAVRVETDIVKSFNLDTLTLGEPVIVAGVEGTEPDEGDIVAAGRSRSTLTPREVLAAFNVTYDWLRKNILNRVSRVSREAAWTQAQQVLNNLFAKRFGKDTVMIAFGGDTSLPADTRTNKALRVLDGFVKQAEADADVHDYVIPASPSYRTQVFPSMMSALPKDYLDDLKELAFFVAPEVWLAYAYEIAERATAIGDQVMLSGPDEQRLYFHGVELLPVFKQPTGRILLTPRTNLAIGFGQSMTQESERKPRARKVEVTITAEMDAKYALGDAIVLGASA